MIYFLDTEFNEFGGELISLALVGENGRSFYRVLPCENPGAWVSVNVIPLLADCPVEATEVDRRGLSRDLARFLHGDPDPVIVSDWPDDIRYFCEALITGPGQMIAIPGVRFQMVRVDAYPTNLPGAVQHNAWWDAMALREKLMPA